MTDRWLFFLDADGRLVSPESAPLSNEARALEAALAAFCDEPIMRSGLPGRDDDRPLGPTALHRAG